MQATDICFDGPITEARAREIIEYYAQAWENRAAYFFGIRLKQNQTLVGSISLMMNDLFPRAELGFWLSRDDWGQGIITEAATALLGFGFLELKLHKIHAQHMSHNPKSGNVMQKIGMKNEGCFRQHVRKQDTWYDMHQYSILKTEYNQLADERLKKLALSPSH